MTYKGIEPLYPAPSVSAVKNEGVVATEIDSLQPMMKWRALQNHTGTYDLIIYEAEDEQSLLGWRTNPSPGKEIYYRENINNTFHILEIPLQADTSYLWTVRTRNGESIGNWATLDYEKYEITLVIKTGPQFFFFHTPKYTNKGSC